MHVIEHNYILLLAIDPHFNTCSEKFLDHMAALSKRCRLRRHSR